MLKQLDLNRNKREIKREDIMGNLPLDSATEIELKKEELAGIVGGQVSSVFQLRDVQPSDDITASLLICLFRF